jgi:hypothetical protein
VTGSAEDRPALDLDPSDEAFLARPRLGNFTTAHTPGPWPAPVPVWFEWTGRVVEMFTGARSPKVRRLEVDPYASLLAANEVGEPEHWVALEGTVAIERDGVGELAERLAARYWDLSRPEHAATVAEWKDQARTMVRLVLTPEHARRYQA